jgi:hypothetical protein
VRAASTAAAAPPTSTLTAESFLNGTSSVYVDEMYRLWKSDAAR